MSNVLMATRRQARELVDGTIEVKLHIEPRYKAIFHALFPEIDMPVALAPLNLQSTVAIAQAAAIAQAEAVSIAPKVTGLAMLAVQWCKLPQFWDFLNDHVALTPVLNEQDAKALVCLECGIDSRKELNTNAVAAEIFERIFRQPCMIYMQKQEAQR